MRFLILKIFQHIKKVKINAKKERKKAMSKLEKMSKEEFINVLSILLKYDPRLKDYDLEFGPEAVNVRLNGQPCGGLAVRNIYDAYERVGDVSQIEDVVKDCVLKLKPQPQPFRQMGQQPEVLKKEHAIIEVKASRVLEILEEMNTPKKTDAGWQFTEHHDSDEDLAKAVAMAKANPVQTNQDMSDLLTTAGKQQALTRTNQNVNDLLTDSGKGSVSSEDSALLTNTAKQQVAKSHNEFSLDDEEEAEATTTQSADGPEVVPAAYDSVNFTPAQEAKEDTKKSSNPQAGMGLKDVLSAALGVPEAGSAGAEAQAEDDRFEL